MKMAIRPVGDKILVQREIATKTAGGLVLPTKVTANEGRVIAVGDGILQSGIRLPSLVKVGDYITWNSGHIRIESDETLVLVPETAIMTVIS
jgi:co-chaperonin GroES (HSP10)